jgi:hypothetical protein
MASTKVPIELSSTPGIVDNSNATAITIDSSENVGIGTSSPTAKLELNGGDAYFYNTATLGGIRIGYNGSNYWDIQRENASTGRLLFSHGGSERVCIQPGGNVGIGTSSINNPFSSNTAVQIGDITEAQSLLTLAGTTQGSIYFADSTSGADRYAGYIDYKHSDNYMAFGGKGNGSEMVRIDSSGNVGINWTAPTARLGIIQSGSSTPGLNITDGTSSDFQILAGYSSGLCVIGPSAGSLAIKTANTERMRIDGSGCVLVNKTSQTGNAIAGLQIKCGNGSSGAYSFAVRNDTDSQNALLIENSGNFYSDFIYNVTTGDAANVNISTSSQVRRSTSSRRYKTNIRDYDKGINAIQTLSPKYFNGINDGDIQFAGLIAEDVHDAGLTEFVQYNADNEPDSLAYNHMIALLVKGIQEQQVLIEQLQAEVALLKGE